MAVILSSMTMIMKDYYIRQLANSSRIDAFVAIFLRVWASNWKRAAFQQSIIALPDQEVSPSQTTRDNCRQIQIQSEKCKQPLAYISPLSSLPQVLITHNGVNSRHKSQEVEDNWQVIC